jgi:hypothetical protein
MGILYTNSLLYVQSEKDYEANIYKFLYFSSLRNILSGTRKSVWNKASKRHKRDSFCGLYYLARISRCNQENRKMKRCLLLILSLFLAVPAFTETTSTDIKFINTDYREMFNSFCPEMTKNIKGLEKLIPEKSDPDYLTYKNSILIARIGQDQCRIEQILSYLFVHTAKIENAINALGEKAKEQGE